MSKFSRFMKQNKRMKENTTYAPTKSLLDENGEPLKFTIRQLTTKENDEIRDACTNEVPLVGKPNMFRMKLNISKYLCKMICSCIVEPNLFDKELQDSYGVMSPEDLIKEMIDDPGEYQNFIEFIQKFNGFNESFEEKVDYAKN